jgi:hypothetical protein
MKGFIPSLADKTALTLFYNKCQLIDFSPYNTFAIIIQKFYKLYIIKVRASVYIQKIYRGFAWREVIFDFKWTNGRYVSRIVEKLRPEWPIRGWSSFIDRRNAGMPSNAHLFSDGVISWGEWARFYDNWVTAFSFYRNPNLTRMRMDYHSSMYYARVTYKFPN